jgi:hypothetical protein
MTVDRTDAVKIGAMALAEGQMHSTLCAVIRQTLMQMINIISAIAEHHQVSMTVSRCAMNVIIVAGKS